MIEIIRLLFFIVKEVTCAIIKQINKSGFIKENIDETIFMFALFKCRKSDKGRN